MHDPREEEGFNNYESELSAIASSHPELSITNKSLKERRRIYMYMFRVLLPHERSASREFRYHQSL